MSKKEILAQEDLEITAATAGAAPIILPGRVISIFPALAHRNFQLYFAGQAISLIGFWLQQVGMGWYVFQLTHSAFWVGTVAALGGLPFLFVTPFAGVFIDKVNRQNLLIWTQVADAFIALVLGALIITHSAGLAIIIPLVAVNGLIGAVDLPARLTFIVEMVGKRDLASAIPINNAVFNGARFVGPALAGALIASFGVGWTFILNALSYIPGIWAIYAMRPVYNYRPEVDIHPLESLKTGLRYSFTHSQISIFITLAALSAIFIWPYQTLMPVIAQNVFHTGAGGYGSLLSAIGAGSLAGAIFASAMSRKDNKGILILAGLVISSLALILFTLNRNFAVAHVLLFIIGFALLIEVATLNTLVQLVSPDNMRGRIMAVYITMFVGMMPLGNALSGIIAQKTSAMFTIGLGAVIVFLVGIALYLKGTFSNFSKNDLPV